jgi:hypothetical protein
MGSTQVKISRRLHEEDLDPLYALSIIKIHFLHVVHCTCTKKTDVRGCHQSTYKNNVAGMIKYMIWTSFVSLYVHVRTGTSYMYNVHVHICTIALHLKLETRRAVKNLSKGQRQHGSKVAFRTATDRSRTPRPEAARQASEARRRSLNSGLSSARSGEQQARVQHSSNAQMDNY